MTPRTPPRARRRVRLLRWLVPALLLGVSCPALGARLTVTIEGLPEKLLLAVRANLTLDNYTGRDVTSAQVRRLLRSSEAEIRGALEPYGYYNPSVASLLQTSDKGLNAVFRVTPGEPVRVTESQVRVEGEGANMPGVRNALRRFSPAVGATLDHGTYEASKSAVDSALFDAGFLRARATAHRVEVSRKANTATIDLQWQSGPRLRFGDVRFSEAQFPPEFLERFIPWQPHDYYSPDELLSFQQRLVDADYFSTVSVQPDLSDTGSEDVPIDVTLSPAKRSVYTAGVYISTDTGPGVRVGMQRRWVNTRGHKLSAEVEHAQRLSALSLGYVIPLPGPNDRTLNFGVTHRDEDTHSSQSRTDRLAANETRQWHGFTRTLGLQYLAGTFEIAEESSYSKLFYAEATLTRKRADDFFFPQRGYSLAFGLRFAPESLLSDTGFSQVTVDAKWIRRLTSRERLILRTSLGAMAVDDFSELPPELRFFAGGDRSIRGFDYQQLGTTNEAGLVIGGEYLTVASAEVEHYFLPKWGLAAFVDGGDAFRRGEFDLNIGAGLGVRWRSPVGVVRLDVGKPVSSKLADTIRFHIAIGPDL